MLTRSHGGTAIPVMPARSTPTGQIRPGFSGGPELVDAQPCCASPRGSTGPTERALPREEPRLQQHGRMHVRIRRLGQLAEQQTHPLRTHGRALHRHGGERHGPAPGGGVVVAPHHGDVFRHPDAERAELALASQDERKAAEDELAGLALPAGWEQAGTRTDDQYVYVTLRKERMSNITELRKAFPKRIAKALEPFSRFNAQERKERLQLTVRLGRYTTMPIAANGP